MLAPMASKAGKGKKEMPKKIEHESHSSRRGYSVVTPETAEDEATISVLVKELAHFAAEQHFAGGPLIIRGGARSGGKSTAELVARRAALRLAATGPGSPPAPPARALPSPTHLWPTQVIRGRVLSAQTLATIKWEMAQAIRGGAAEGDGWRTVMIRDEDEPCGG